ncbi:unnamed protein product [Chrysoparadoxa australica]
MGCTMTKEGKRSDPPATVIKAESPAIGTSQEEANGKGGIEDSCSAHNGSTREIERGGNSEANNDEGFTAKKEEEEEEEDESFFGLYSVGVELGHGSYSTVRSCTCKKTGARKAVKCIKRASFPDEDQKLLMKEVEHLKELDHPSIIGFTELFQETHFYHIIMELAEGGELFDRLVEKTYYEEHDARALAKELLEGVSYAHSMGVVHRDLNPQNVLLAVAESDTRVKIADWGFSEKISDDNDDEALKSQCGTMGYVAPEVLCGKAQGKPIDLWACGVIFYMILCGYPPWHDDNQERLYAKIRRAKVRFHRQYWGEISKPCKDLIKRMLTSDPRARITADDALRHPWLATPASMESDYDLTAGLAPLGLTPFRDSELTEPLPKSKMSSDSLASDTSQLLSGDTSRSPVVAAPKHTSASPTPVL